MTGLTMRRDPFARQELRRLPYAYGPSQGATCSWCGSRRHLFTYQTESDGGRVSRHTGAFCNIGCHDSYHCV